MKTSPVASEWARLQSELESPEMRLLAAAMRSALDPALSMRFEERMEEPFDAEAFLSLCEIQRLAPLVHAMVIKPHRSRFPPGALSTFEEGLRRKNLNHLRQTASLVAIHRAFKLAGVPHAFLKGPVLSDRIFGSRILRHSGDMDVLIHPRDGALAHACLLKIGFRRKTSTWRERLRLPAHWHHRKDSTYGSGNKGWVELHTRTDISEAVLSRGFDLARETDLADFHGERLPVLPRLLECVYLCVHASGHHWSHFGWLLDIVLFIRKHDLAAGAVLEQARRRGLETPVREAFFLADTLLGTDYVNTPGLRPPEPADLERLSLCRRLILRPDRSKGETLTLLLERSKLYPGMIGKLRYLSVQAADQVLTRLGNRPLDGTPGKRTAS